MGGPPRILIVGLESLWIAVARMPQALQRAGFAVGIVCFPNSLLAATRFRDQCFLWRSGFRGGALLRQLEEIVADWPPDLLVPADDMAVVYLARVFERIKDSRSKLAELLLRSLGNPAAFAEAASKNRTIQMARQIGLRVPASRQMRNVSDALEFAGGIGYPIVLKQSFGWAGGGVAVCRNESEVAAIWEQWHRHAGWKGRFYDWRNQIRGDALTTRWLPADRSVFASEFIRGRPAMCQAVSFEGRMLAAVTAVKEERFPDECAPSSVVRFVPNEPMRIAAERLLKAWRMTGFVSFDFMIDTHDNAWLLECNPRPTALAHLGARAGEDLCAAMLSQLTGRPLPAMAQKGELVVAHFPQELQRDPASPHLTTAFHDVPEDDPALLQRLSRMVR